ncbi:phosphotransferase [Phytohabitans flavus]|uniref:phosphotransferase n=1 Tax=Phytohabitans flavus TaxID=1076124 RepID=UPI0036424A09
MDVDRLRRSRGNLLLKDGQLAAVIDFGTCGVGDPACDLAIAWTLVTADGRQAFRKRLSVDEATWARSSGLATWPVLARRFGLFVGCVLDGSIRACRMRPSMARPSTTRTPVAAARC